jgi:RimJ/RimL family protein N-acetyltransferase
MSSPGQLTGRPDLGHVVGLRNGAAVHLRPIRPDDAPRLLEFCGRLSPQTVYQRFFTVRRPRPEDAATLSEVDGHDGMAIVAEHELGPRSELVGVARYALGPEDQTPDLGLVVEDAWQGLGLGSVLLSEILRAGEAHGFSTYHAEILADNARMRGLLASSVDILDRSMDHGVITVVFRRPLVPSTFDLAHHPQPHGGSA